jgi:hypothetical protein
VTVRPVRTLSDAADFLAAPRVVYGGDPAFVDLPATLVAATFQPHLNPRLAAGAAARFVARSGDGRLLGRVAAFLDAPGGAERLGGLGFYACVDDADAAAALLAAGVSWLLDQGATVVDGPVNFGERDRCWGLLVSDHRRPTVYLDNWNPSYVQAQFEAAGFAPRMESVAYALDPAAVDVASLQAACAAGVGVDRFTCATLAELGIERFAQGLHRVYEAAFPTAGRARHWSAAELQTWLERDATLDPETLYLGFVDGEASGVIGYQPDLNQAARGEAVTRIKGFLAASLPGLHARGVGAGIAARAHTDLVAAGVREVVMTGIAGHSARMSAIARALGGVPGHVHVTWRLRLDGRPVSPLPMPAWGDRWWSRRAKAAPSTPRALTEVFA